MPTEPRRPRVLLITHSYRPERTPPARTLVELFDTTAREHPDATALDDGVEPLTYAELRERVDVPHEKVAVRAQVAQCRGARVRLHTQLAQHMQHVLGEHGRARRERRSGTHRRQRSTDSTDSKHDGRKRTSRCAGPSRPSERAMWRR